ncbi:MAG: hypothetical protein DI537_34700 [Stutzerimonas stutzeri]|nr:MAG: hypothetical protein DI537_34700 [Stutzerimonas stutzeri]
MSRPDATASAALDADIIAPAFFVFLDILGDPVRFTTLPRDVVLTGTGFPEMDGETFIGVGGEFVDISDVKIKAGGSDQVVGKLSGLREIDNDTLNTIGDPANWQGREAMLWRMIRDENRVQQGGLQHYYTGYMTALDINGDPGSQVIELTIETYLAAFSKASNRTYMDQERYDPGDLSARAALATANGMSSDPLVNTTATTAPVVNRSTGYRGLQ